MISRAHASMIVLLDAGYNHANIKSPFLFYMVILHWALEKSTFARLPQEFRLWLERQLGHSVKACTEEISGIGIQ